MARYTGPVCKLCRREGLKLFLKGQKCLTEKCTFNDRKNPPGPNSGRRGKLTGYAIQLREKQKAKRVYGVIETQFRNYYAKALKMKGITGENLLILLERRLDNTLYRTGIAASRSQARNFISHGHVYINEKRVDIASYQVRVGDQITLSPKLKESVIVENNIAVARGVGLVADWFELSEDGRSGKIVKFPVRENVDIPIKEQIIIEHYSK
jgi:small subunit ribosomal protein S4